MKNMQIAGTGNSRWMKSAISETATWEEFRAMLRAGTFPFDFNGINEEGIVTKGTPYDVDNILKDSTAASLGGDETMVPDEALVALKELVGAASNLANDNNARIEVVSYTGTAYKRREPYSADKKLYFSFVPQVVMLIDLGVTPAVAINPCTTFRYDSGSATYGVKISWDDTNKCLTLVNWNYAINNAETTYYAAAIGYGVSS